MIGLKSASKNTEHSGINPLTAMKRLTSSFTVMRQWLEHQGSSRAIKIHLNTFLPKPFSMHKSTAVLQNNGTITEQREQWSSSFSESGDVQEVCEWVPKWKLAPAWIQTHLRATVEGSAYMENLFRSFDTDHVSIITAQVNMTRFREYNVLPAVTWSHAR